MGHLSVYLWYLGLFFLSQLQFCSSSLVDDFSGKLIKHQLEDKRTCTFKHEHAVDEGGEQVPLYYGSVFVVVCEFLF